MPFRDFSSDERDMTRYFEYSAIPLYKYALKLSDDPQIAEDIVQNTFMKLIRYFDNVRGFSNERFFLYAKRVLVHEFGAELKIKSTISLITDMDMIQDKEENIDFIDAILTRDEIKRCINQLNPKYKIIVYLRYFENKTSTQIGQILNIPDNHVRTILSRARNELKRKYKEIKEGNTGRDQ